MGTRIWLIGFIFGLCETGYFGWNFFPQSSAEIVCDGISLAIMCFGFAVGAIGTYLREPRAVARQDQD